MLSVRLIARIPAEKRQEFLDSLKAFAAKEKGSLCRKFLFEGVGDDTLYCWMGDCDSKEALESFMQSDTFRALRGAAQVLGTLEEVRVVKDLTR